jgi:hypothetical protein
LFILVLEKSHYGHKYPDRGKIFYKSVQLIAFADKIDIIGKTLFLALNTVAEAMGLKVNKGKTRYVIFTGNKINNDCITHNNFGS